MSSPDESAPIEANVVTEHDDADSAVDAESITSSTVSLTESIFDYRRLHGRTYPKNHSVEYWAPNDEQQNEGLDLTHNALLMLLDDKLFLAPIGENIQRVLDVGTGTGIWAIDFCDQFPNTEVIGTDISPIQPAWVPPNVKFMIDDCLQEWTWPDNHFDFVHFRSLFGSIPDWAALYAKAFRHLKPGGWLQHLEMETRIASDHKTFPKDHVFNQWADLIYAGGERTGRSFDICQGNNMKQYMEGAGFVNVVEVKMKAPLHGWPKNPQLQQVGLMFHMALDQSLEGFGMFLMTQILGWSREEMLVLLAKMRKENNNRANCHWAQV
jgi:SAM-dependent methyltransferase